MNEKNNILCFKVKEEYYRYFDELPYWKEIKARPRYAQVTIKDKTAIRIFLDGNVNYILESEKFFDSADLVLVLMKKALDQIDKLPNHYIERGFIYSKDDIYDLA